MISLVKAQGFLQMDISMYLYKLLCISLFIVNFILFYKYIYNFDNTYTIELWKYFIEFCIKSALNKRESLNTSEFLEVISSI